MSDKTIILLLFTAFAIYSCETIDQKQIARDIKVEIENPSGTLQDTENIDSLSSEEYFTAYVVIADTGHNYYKMKEFMEKLSKESFIKIDTMERAYSKSKDLIALPDNYPDELYAGDYYPRRDTSEFLSLEYLNFYQDGSIEKTIALVTGIYPTELEANVAVTKIQKYTPNVIKLKSQIYMGCLH